MEKKRDIVTEEFLSRFSESIRPAKDWALISIDFDKDCSVEYLYSLHLHTSNRISTFEIVLEKMQKDYSIILGEEVTIVENSTNRTLKLHDSKLSVANLSIAIQKRKYKGDDDKLYDEVTLKEFRYKGIENSKN